MSSSSSSLPLDEKEVNHAIVDGVHIPTNFKGIIISYGDVKFEMTPCKLLYVTDTEYLVVIYKLIYTNADEIMETQIPYYLSDGFTNEFKCNLLLPFICFDDRQKKNQATRNNGNCFRYIPENKHDNTGAGMLFKLHIKGMNLKWVNDDILRGISGHLAEYIYARDHINGVSNTGLGSVVDRITNLLDFYIGTSILPPVYTPKMCIPSRNKIKRYMINNISEGVPSLHGDPLFVNDIKEYYRCEIHKSLLFIKGQLENIKDHIITTNNETLYPEKIDSDNFNNIYDICKNIYVYKKIYYYQLISNKLSIFIHMLLNRTQITDIPPNEESIKFRDTVIGIVSPPEIIREKNLEEIKKMRDIYNEKFWGSHAICTSPEANNNIKDYCESEEKVIETETDRTLPTTISSVPDQISESAGNIEHHYHKRDDDREVSPNSGKKPKLSEGGAKKNYEIYHANKTIYSKLNIL